MRKHDLISSTLWFFVGLFVFLYAPQYDLGTAELLGPGFMPFLSGILMCSFSALTFYEAYQDKSGKAKEIWGNIRFWNLIFVLFLILIYTLLLEKFGFILCTFFLIALLLRFIDPQTWFKSILGGGLSSILLYLIFETWLKAELPRGILGF